MVVVVVVVPVVVVPVVVVPMVPVEVVVDVAVEVVVDVAVRRGVSILKKFEKKNLPGNRLPLASTCLLGTDRIRTHPQRSISH